MGIVTKSNGKILMFIGLAFFFVGLIGGSLSYATYGKEWGYTPMGYFLAFSMVVIGPILCIMGISVFVMGARRFQKYPSKLIVLLKSGARTKLSSLAKLLEISEKDVKRMIHELQLNGESIVIDRITTDVAYDSASPLQLSHLDANASAVSLSEKKLSSGWSSYEKLSLAVSVVSIVTGIVLALLLR